MEGIVFVIEMVIVKIMMVMEKIVKYDVVVEVFG